MMTNPPKHAPIQKKSQLETSHDDRILIRFFRKKMPLRNAVFTHDKNHQMLVISKK